MMEIVPRFLMDVGIVLVPLCAGVAWFAWWKNRELYRRALGVVSSGVWCSQHQTVHAERTPDYFDADLFLSNPREIGIAMSWFKEELDNQEREGGAIDRLIFIERHDEGPVGAITLKDLLSWETSLPTAIVRPARKGPALRVKCVETDAVGGGIYRPKTKFRGDDGSPEHVILVSDVATTGKTLLEAAGMIKECGGVVDASFVLYDRMEGAEDALKEYGIRLSAMLDANELSVFINKEKNIGNIAQKKQASKYA